MFSPLRRAAGGWLPQMKCRGLWNGSGKSVWVQEKLGRRTVFDLSKVRFAVAGAATDFSRGPGRDLLNGMKPVLDGVDHNAGDILRLHLVQDSSAVAFDSALADAQFFAYLFT